MPPVWAQESNEGCEKRSFNLDTVSEIPDHIVKITKRNEEKQLAVSSKAVTDQSAKKQMPESYTAAPTFLNANKKVESASERAKEMILNFTNSFLSQYSNPNDTIPHGSVVKLGIHDLMRTQAKTKPKKEVMLI